MSLLVLAEYGKPRMQERLGLLCLTNKPPTPRVALALIHKIHQLFGWVQEKMLEEDTWLMATGFTVPKTAVKIGRI